jgi:hypothetical protein
MDESQKKYPAVRGGTVNAAVVHKSPKGAEESSSGSKPITPYILEGPPANVTGSIGITLALRPYEFLRIDVGGTLPCDVNELKDLSAHRQLFLLLREELKELSETELKKWKK